MFRYSRIGYQQTVVAAIYVNEPNGHAQVYGPLPYVLTQMSENICYVAMCYKSFQQVTISNIA